MDKRLLGLALAGALLLSGCGGEIVSEGRRDPEGTPVPTASAQPSPWASARPTPTPSKREYEWTDPTGVYHNAVDDLSILTIVPIVDADGYAVSLELSRRFHAEGQGSYDEAGIFTFAGTDPNGEPFAAVVTRDGNNVLVTVVESHWTGLPSGTIYSFLRNLPQVTAEAFRELFLEYVGAYPGADETIDTSVEEARAAWALVQFAVDNHLYYRNLYEVHRAAHEGYMSLPDQEMYRFDYNLYNGLYQLVEDAFKDYRKVRSRFRAAGVEEEMEKLLDTADSYTNWGALRNHLFVIGSPTISYS